MGLNFKNSKVYLIIVFALIVSKTLSDFTIPRYSAVSVVVDNKLYIIGGYSARINSPTDALFYLNLTSDFNVTNVPWVDSTKIPVASVWSLASSNKSTIFLIGGIMLNSTNFNLNNDSLVYTYDVNQKIWTIPKMTGLQPANRRESSSVVDNNGKIYFFG